MQKQNKAYLFAIIVVLLWSTVASAFKISLRYLDFFQLLFFSSLVSIIVLFCLLLIQGKIHLLKKISKKNILSSAILGFFNPFLYYLVLLKAYSLLQAQEAGTLNYIWPIVLVLLSIPLLKQKISLLSLLAILISFAGVIIISTHGNIFSLKFSNTLGVCLAVGSAFFWAIYWIFSIKDKREIVSKLFLNFVFGFIYILIVTLIFSKIEFPVLEGILGVTYIGLFEMGITFVIWLKALKLSTTTAKVSNLIYFAPFLSLIFIHFAVGEQIRISTVAGLIFIISGILLQQFSNKSKIN